MEKNKNVFVTHQYSRIRFVCLVSICLLTQVAFFFLFLFLVLRLLIFFFISYILRRAIFASKKKKTKRKNVIIVNPLRECLCWVLRVQPTRCKAKTNEIYWIKKNVWKEVKNLARRPRNASKPIHCTFTWPMILVSVLQTVRDFGFIFWKFFFVWICRR